MRYAFVQTDAELIEPKDYEASVAGRERALKMYQRALGYCLRRVELTTKDFGGGRERSGGDDEGVLEEEVPVLYWTGATWGAVVSAGSRSPSCSISCRSSARSWAARSNSTKRELGAIHDVLISLDSLPEAMGGSVKDARMHYAPFGGALERGIGQSAFRWRRASASLSRIARSSRTCSRRRWPSTSTRCPACGCRTSSINGRRARSWRARTICSRQTSLRSCRAMVGLTGLDSLAYRGWE